MKKAYFVFYFVFLMPLGLSAQGLLTQVERRKMNFLTMTTSLKAWRFLTPKLDELEVLALACDQSFEKIGLSPHCFEASKHYEQLFKVYPKVSWESSCDASFKSWSLSQLKKANKAISTADPCLASLKKHLDLKDYQSQDLILNLD